MGTLAARGDDPARSAARELISSLGTAEQLAAVPDTTAPSARTVAFTSSTPGNTLALDVITGVWAWARRTEAAAFQQVTGRERTPRGGSNGNTYAAIERIADLAGDADDGDLMTRGLERWADRANALPAVDATVTWNPVPGRPLCPYCSTPSLRVAHGRYVVACWLAGCKDKDGRTPPTGSLRVSGTADAEIAWADGTITRAGSITRDGEC